MAPLLYVQLSGIPGTGKTTLQGSLVRAIPNAVAIDKDYDMAYFGEHLPDLQGDDLAEAAYGRALGRADDALRSGRSVIFDSPLYREFVAAGGARVAAARGAEYRVVELRCADRQTLQARLDGRPSRNYPANADLSQPSAVPEGAPHLIIDTTDLTKAEVLTKATEWLGLSRVPERTAPQDLSRGL